MYDLLTDLQLKLTHINDIVIKLLPTITLIGRFIMEFPPLHLTSMNLILTVFWIG